ncbi:hypothetical protein Tco_0622605 [Tanacetum coccineum]
MGSLMICFQNIFSSLPQLDGKITDTGDAVVALSMPRSDTESEHSEQSSDDIPMQDEGQSRLECTDNALIPRCRPLRGKKKLCKADLEGPAFNLVKAFHKNNVFLQYQMDECWYERIFKKKTKRKPKTNKTEHGMEKTKVDLDNSEGHQTLRNVYEPLPLGGSPGQVTIQPQFFFNKDLDYLLTGDKEQKIALSISNATKRRYLVFGLEELVRLLWLKVNAIMTSVRSMASLTGGSEERNSTSTNTVSPLIVKQSDRRCEFSFVVGVKKCSQSPQDRQDSLHTAVNMWIRNLVIRNRVGDLQLGIESYQTKINLERPNWDAADYYSKKILRLSLMPRAVVIEDRMINEHPSETMVFHNEDGNPARANIKQALGSFKDGDTQPHKGVKASANSDVMYFFTSAQDGDPLQDDVRLCLGDDLKKAQDHSQRQAGDLP